MSCSQQGVLLICVAEYLERCPTLLFGCYSRFALLPCWLRYVRVTTWSNFESGKVYLLNGKSRPCRVQKQTIETSWTKLKVVFFRLNSSPTNSERPWYKCRTKLLQKWSSETWVVPCFSIPKSTSCKLVVKLFYHQCFPTRSTTQ